MRSAGNVDSTVTDFTRYRIGGDWDGEVAAFCVTCNDDPRRPHWGTGTLRTVQDAIDAVRQHERDCHQGRLFA